MSLLTEVVTVTILAAMIAFANDGGFWTSVATAIASTALIAILLIYLVNNDDDECK